MNFLETFKVGVVCTVMSLGSVFGSTEEDDSDYDFGEDRQESVVPPVKDKDKFTGECNANKKRFVIEVVKGAARDWGPPGPDGMGQRKSNDMTYNVKIIQIDRTRLGGPRLEVTFPFETSAPELFVERMQELLELTDTDFFDIAGAKSTLLDACEVKYLNVRVDVEPVWYSLSKGVQERYDYDKGKWKRIWAAR